MISLEALMDSLFNASTLLSTTVFGLAILLIVSYWSVYPFLVKYRRNRRVHVLSGEGECASVEIKAVDEARQLPGPTPLPFIGNSHQVLYSDGYLKLTKWAEQYGRIFVCYYGHKRQVVVSDRRLAKQLQCSEVIGSGRTQGYATNRALGDCVMGSENELWEKLRRFEMATWKHLGVGTPLLDAFITTQTDTFVAELSTMAQQGTETDLLMPVFKTVVNILGNLVLGSSFEDNELDNLLEMNMGLTGFFASPTVDMVNSTPLLRHILPRWTAYNKLETSSDNYRLYLKGKVERLKAMRQAEGIDMLHAHPRTFTEAWIQKVAGDTDLTESNFLALLMEQFIPGVEVTVAFIWTVKILLSQPAALAKVLDEINANVEKGVDLTWANHDKFPYLNAAILETWRMARFSPCSFPRRAKADCVVDGYFIPKDSKVFFLRYAATRDPTYFKNPQEFSPERFISTEERKAETRWYDPFGYGKRMCPGGQLANMICFQLTVKLFYNLAFDVVVPQINNLEHALEYTRQGFLLTPFPFRVLPELKA